MILQSKSRRHTSFQVVELAKTPPRRSRCSWSLVAPLRAGRCLREMVHSSRRAPDTVTCFSWFLFLLLPLVFSFFKYFSFSLLCPDPCSLLLHFSPLTVLVLFSLFDLLCLTTFFIRQTAQKGIVFSDNSVDHNSHKILKVEEKHTGRRKETGSAS